MSINWRLPILLIVLAAGTAVIVLRVQSSPGYMDADYYYAGGIRLAEGHGFSEEILWNYLDNPTGLPHPSHGYWMPLASMIAGAGMLVTGQTGFTQARLAFILIAIAFPLLVARLAWRLTGRRDHALLAGLLAVFSGFYLPYLYTTESFSLYILFGSLFFLLLCETSGSLKPFFLGGLAGLMHLTRADGILWLAIAFGVVFFIYRKPYPIINGRREIMDADSETGPVSPAIRIRVLSLSLCTCLAGYLLVMGPWLLRNLNVFNALLAPGGARALWLTNYDELFIYPGSILTPARWWASGLATIVRARLWALGINLQSVIAVQGLVFLAPLELVGLWRLRRQPAVRAGVCAWLLTLTAMTIVFPYQGARGGFFHSSAALQPLLWAAAPSGLEAFVGWGVMRRGWNRDRAWRLFGSGAVLLAAVFTGLVTVQRLRSSGKIEAAEAASPAVSTLAAEAPSGWNASWQRYLVVEDALRSWGAAPGAAVMANNPPGYYAAAQRPAISIPFGDRAALLSAAQRYGAEYLLVEIEQVQGESLYSTPGDQPGLHYLCTRAEVVIYAILPP